jgi:hypothetical protein
MLGILFLLFVVSVVIAAMYMWKKYKKTFNIIEENDKLLKLGGYDTNYFSTGQQDFNIY